MNRIGKLITGAYRLRQALARALYLGAPVPNDAAEALRRDGVVVLPRLLPAGEVANINEANAEWFDFERRGELAFSPDGKALLDAAAAPAEEVRRFYFLHVKNYQRKFDVYARALPRLEPLLSSYYASRFFVRDTYCYRNQPVPAAQGSYAWHRDNYPPGSLKVMLYLTPVVKPEDGPLTLALGSHRGFAPELGKIGDRYEDSWVRERYQPFDCLGEPGTAIVFNNNAIHRATDPVEGHRDAINFTVFPSIFPAVPSAVKGLDLTEEKTWLKRYTR